MLQLFNYNNNQVSFRKANDTVYVNATEMAKPFGKLPNEYLRLPSTKELIGAITGKSRISENQTVIIKRGSAENGGGTWLNEDLAIDFAQWLSVDFRLWVADRIKELMKFGFTATEQTLEDLANNPDLLIELATALKTERAQRQLAENQLQLANKTIIDNAPKVKLAEECYSSTGSMTASTISARLGFRSANAFNLKLKALGIQYKIKGDECWKLTSRYSNRGYTKTIPFPYLKSDGSTGTRNQMEWTEAGFVFLREFINKKAIAS